MPTLEVTNFSCIKGAVLELKPITILTGPQAAGKSVLTKLSFFFTELPHRQFDAAEEGLSFDRYKAQVLARFEEWFPPSAWGKKSFKITYRSGDEISYTITRTVKKKPSSLEISFSDYLTTQYLTLLDEFKKGKAAVSEPDDDDFFGGRYERIWRVRNAAFRTMSAKLGTDFVRSQTFIPAGRSFFTNLGKAVAMLEHGNQLDEVTRKFGRLFTTLLDGHNYYFPDKPDEKTKDFLASQKDRLENLFGGKIRIGENDRHVATDDGRKIPFSILSSGQQELLPLLLILQYKMRMLAGVDDKSTEIIYVEEPEAHLFPEAQGQLVEYIAAISAFFKGKVLFLITTHSPYVISKFNNLIKAFTVATFAPKGSGARVEGIVDRKLWLPPASVNAYALHDGNLRSVNDRTGLIDGDYLDGISEDISETFLSLLEAETEIDRERMSLAEKTIKDKIGGER